jgi:hypothetical protein
MLDHHKKPHHTFMYLWILGALAVLITGMAAYALEHPRTASAPVIIEVATTTPSETTPIDTETTGTFVLRLNETGESHGWTVTPTALVEDSRCPADVQCIQAGTVRVSVRIGDATAKEQTLTVLEPALIEGGRITLLTVDPAPISTKPIEKTEYRFTFLVEKL